MTSPTKAEKVSRMKDVRTDVKTYMANPKQWDQAWGISHLGEYPTTMADARRTIIALQDLLTDRTERHETATNMVQTMKHVDQANLSLENTILAGQQTKDLVASQEWAYYLQSHCETNGKTIVEQNVEIDKLTHEKAALMATIKMLMEGGAV